MEDKKKITKLLGEVLKLTRAGEDLTRLEYESDEEAVYGYFGDSPRPSRRINVACDSGYALIKDVINNIDIG